MKKKNENCCWRVPNFLRGKLRLLRTYEGSGAACDVFLAAMDYCIDKEQPDMTDWSTSMKMVFDDIRQKRDEDVAKYQTKTERTAAAIKRRWEERKNAPAAAEAAVPESRAAVEPDNGGGNVPESRRVGESGNGAARAKRFAKPSVEEVRAYCEERKNTVDPVRFVDYYESCGWSLGHGKAMKDWKAAVRTWERNSGYNTKTNDIQHGVIRNSDSTYKLPSRER